MSTESLAQPARAATRMEQEEAHSRLLDAAREALAWFDRQEEHAPEGLRLGGEGKIRRLLREAIRRASFEIRACPDCDGGTSLSATSHPMDRPTPVACPSCGGSGERRVYAYTRPKARRNR